MQTYHEDGYIDYWGAIYTSNNFINKKITFEFFLSCPYQIIDAIQFMGNDALINNGVFYPLLPRQAKVQQQTDAQILAEVIQDEMDARYERDGHVLEMQGDKTIERFHHHAVPKKWKTNTKLGGIAS